MELARNFACTLALSLTVAAACAVAQSTPPAEKPGTPAAAPDAHPIRTFYLVNATRPNEGNEILTTVRNMQLEPEMRIYLTPTQNAISVRGTPEQVALFEQLIQQLDRPHRTFRLTYTITELDAGKRIGVQHFSMVVPSGQRTTLKEGSKVPVITGSFDEGKNATQNQLTYLDVGLNFDATLDDFPSGVRMKSKVERSDIAEQKSSVGAGDPIVRQSVLEGTSMLTVGKPLVLGSLDIPDSTRRLEIEAEVEPLP